MSSPDAPGRRAVLGLALALPWAAAGCGWTPLYADRETGPADAELRAIRVDPISERIGQNLELELRRAFNPDGLPAQMRYVLVTTLLTVRSDLGVQIQGLGTRGKLDVTARYVLRDLKTGAILINEADHVVDSFDILANGYANIVSEEDARRRAVRQLRDDIVERLTLFMQRRIAPG